MTEREIAEGCQRGDNAARRALYERYGGRLLALCRRYTGNREEAEDLLHDGFLFVFSAIATFGYRGDGSLSAWLCRVFANRAVDYLQQRRRLAFTDTGEVPDVPEDPPPADVPAEAVVRLIGELPPGYRTVLNLYLIEGHSHREIAALLHIKESTSASQYLRAKALLKKRITDYLKTHDA